MKWSLQSATYKETEAG